MENLTALREIPNGDLYRPGDVFVLFGELFGRGYVSGLLDAAKSAGMTIIGITVGRREADQSLRPLNDDELTEAESHLGGRIINVPLMAGFDLDAPLGAPTPTDILSAMTLESWEATRIDWAHIATCREVGVSRFTGALTQVMSILEGMIPDGRNVHFAHTMAGGIPKAKTFMVLANRIYKGRGSRHMSSQALLASDMGKFILQNFDEVSARTFHHLIEGSKPVRDRIEATGGHVRYSAYGYHGTEILLGDRYRWQTYTNYTQGFAKMQLENIARDAWNSGIRATVYNCPEIRTNSSDVFAGIELPLLSLLSALMREGPGDWATKLWKNCGALLRDEFTVEDLLRIIVDYGASSVMQPFFNFSDWPMPNSRAQSDLTIGLSSEITAMHKDTKCLISDRLSDVVVQSTGRLIFGESVSPSAPVLWLNHDIVARELNSFHNRRGESPIIGHPA